MGYEDIITLHPYDASWPARHEAELARIQDVLPAGAIIRAEHIGSTAVPGMLAKPVVDILLAVDDLEHAREPFPPLFESLGYAFWADNPKRDRLFFERGLPPNGPRTFHVHVTTPDSTMWDRVLFRDYLRAHPDEAKRYEHLKQSLAARFPDDREAYSEGKTEYDESVVAKANRRDPNGIDQRLRFVLAVSRPTYIGRTTSTLNVGPAVARGRATSLCSQRWRGPSWASSGCAPGTDM